MKILNILKLADKTMELIIYYLALFVIRIIEFFRGERTQ